MLSQAAKRDYKRLTIDIEAEKYRMSEALITSDEGIETRINRSIQDEGSFSLLKAAFGYRTAWRETPSDIPYGLQMNVRALHSGSRRTSKRPARPMLI